MYDNVPTVHKIGNPLAPAGQGQEVALSHSGGNAALATDIQRGIAEVQASFMIAQARPRNQVAAVDRMMTECQRPTLAEQAVYSYPRGGVEVTGPTIRLAEMLARSWGNIKCGWRCLDRKPGRSLIQAFALDLETNFMDDIVFEVPHFRDTKREGRKPLTDDRDIYEMEANQAARRLRKCILTLIPGDIIDACLAQCEETLQSTSSNSPDSIAKMVKAFIPFGVNQKMIEARLGRKIETISSAQVAGMKKIYASIKDGMSDAGQWFDMSLADKEPIDVAEKNEAAQEPKKRGRKPKEQVAAQPGPQKAADTSDFNKENAPASNKGKPAPRSDHNPPPPASAENNALQQSEEKTHESAPSVQENQHKTHKSEGSCEKCGGSGVISEETDEGEVIEYACARCSGH